MKEQDRLTVTYRGEIITYAFKDGVRPIEYRAILAQYEDTGLSQEEVNALKHKLAIAEEALRLAFDEWTCCDSCMFSVDCKTNRTDCKKAEISKIKQQAEARLKEKKE